MVSAKMVQNPGEWLVTLLLTICILGLGLEPRCCNGDTDQGDVSTLGILYSSLNSPGQLTGWVSSGGDPCGQSWKGVTCSGNRVTAIKLSGLGLSGSLGYQLSFSALRELDLSNNNIAGDIPYSLPQNVEKINLANNQLSGSSGLPYSMSQMPSLKYLNVAHNQLKGSLNDIFGHLSSLTFLDVSFNQLTGDLPESFTNLSSINSMYMQNNQLTGTIDVLASLPLQNLNVGNNQFRGWIPDRLKNINLQRDGNSWSSGPAPPPPPGTPPASSKDRNHKSGGSGSSSGDSGGNKGKSGISGGAIAGIIISLLVVGAIVAFFFWRRRRYTSSSFHGKKSDAEFSALTASNNAKEDELISSASSLDKKAFDVAPASISLRPPPVERLKSFNEEDLQTKPIVVKKSVPPPKNVSVYSIADLQIATGSFSIENLLGEGSFGRVYRAQFADGKVFAVKKIDSSALPSAMSNEFMEVVSNISRIDHTNVTKLIGYCSEHGQHLLVYEFHKNGSLRDYMHLYDDESKPLIWNSRVKIALGTARALEYLHEVCSPSIIHKNIKSANILLDSELNPHLSDSGLASFLPNADQVLHRGEENSGYVAPEVTLSGQYSLKSDIYSFGVVMLELLTGRRPFDSSRPRSEQLLVRWATPQLHDIDALEKMVDPALVGLYPVKSLSRFADVIALCVQPEPEFRPPMSEVVEALVRLVQRANMSKRTVGKEGPSPRADQNPDMQDYM